MNDNLAALKSELDDNLDIVNRELNYRRAVISSTERLVAKSEEARLADSSQDEVGTLLGDLTWIGISDFSTGALESLLQSGVFGYIDDGELRRMLAALPARYDFVIKFEERDVDSSKSRLLPYLSAHGYFNQIANTTNDGRPGTGEFANDTKYRVMEVHDYSALLQSDEFLGMVTQKNWDHSNVVDALERQTGDGAGFRTH